MKMVQQYNKAKKFKSIKLAAQAAGVPYMTFYMRLRAADKVGGLGWKASTAMHKPVRVYRKKEEA